MRQAAALGTYDRDFHAWTVEQAALIRSRSANALDWENLAEEVESLGRRQRWELYNRLVVLCTHLLKWSHQPGARSRSRGAAIRVQRRDIGRLLEASPSLKAAGAEEFEAAYDTARVQTAAETGLADSTFPEAPAFTLDEALTDGPGPDAEAPGPA